MTSYDGFKARYTASSLSEPEYNALVVHAAELVSFHILAGYTDADTAKVTAIENATYDQIATWEETGDGNDLAGYARGTEMQLGGSLKIVGQPASFSPRALRTLWAAGLLRLYGA